MEQTLRELIEHEMRKAVGNSWFTYQTDSILTLVKQHIEQIELSLITNDDYEHPHYPNQLRLTVIPLWDVEPTYTKNQYRLIAEAQFKSDKQKLMKSLEE